MSSRSPQTSTEIEDAPESLSRVDYVVRELGLAIASGAYQPDDNLPIEQELCDRFAVGRNAVREAIKVLSAKGFVRTERRAGTIVQPRRSWAMLDPEVLSWMLVNEDLRQELLGHLSLLRRIIEPEAAALAAQHASITETLRLFEAFEEMSQHRHDRSLAIKADIKFHERMLEASHNPLLVSMAKSIDVLLHANFSISIEQPDGFIRNLDQHGKVAEAISRRDANGARKEMQTLLDNNDADLEHMLGGRSAPAKKRR
jgi:DNA-binding FadR family transcriptional regulator